MRVATMVFLLFWVSEFEARVGPQVPADTITFSHGVMTCLQGGSGPGTRLILTQKQTCQGGNRYPSFEIDIRQIMPHAPQVIAIGPDNWAFNCPSPKESCTQFMTGKVVFEHFKQPVKNEPALTDGYFELRSRSSTEHGRFKVDCFAPCA